MNKTVDVTIKMSDVRVLIAIDDNKVKECIVVPAVSTSLEWGLRQALIEIYGGANVCSASRTIGDIPSSISRYVAEKFNLVKEWIPNTNYSRPPTGKRVLAKLKNNWVCCATHWIACDRPIWKNDTGADIDNSNVLSWKELE